MNDITIIALIIWSNFKTECMPLLIRDAEIPTSVRVLVMEYFQKSFNLIKKLGQKQINFYRPISLLIKVYKERD